MRILAVCLALLAAPVAAIVPTSGAAHEFWLEPTAYQVPGDGSLEAHIVNGQFFAGLKLPYIPNRIRRFEAFAGPAEETLEMRIGDLPGLAAPAAGPGLNVVIYESTVATVKYDDPALFPRFVEHKDFAASYGDVLARHAERGLPASGFSEAYWRYCKTLIGVGDGAGSDSRKGMETEFVALTNPYTDDLSGGFRAQLFYGDSPRANVQVELYEKAPDGTVEVTRHHTDGDGIATLPVKPGYSYMLDSVVIREPSQQLAAQTGAVWETLWASLTFAAPAE